MKFFFTLILIFFGRQIIIAQNDTMLKLFRTTTIQNQQKISLRSNIETLKDVADKRDIGHYYLKRKTYKKADSILIEVNNANQIMAVKFVYEHDDTPYADEIPFFQKIINSKGTEYKYSSKNKSISVTKWQDKSTILELAEIIIGEKNKPFLLFLTESFTLRNMLT
jgi:hypothetical protein